jgi:hypothetical protein
MPGLFCHSANCLADWERLGWLLLLCSMLLVVGTPTLHPEDVTRLARAYYHADSAAIDERERARRGWALALPRCADASCVANALMRAELTRVGASQPATALGWAGGGDAVRGRSPLAFP